ncbi:Hypothetical_protein [Hexamita inflata]|uniref:Hypothetical_protein n=1 Tax=Hexamita inflata TaxID=28002 RepID=A0AA86PPM0_9EUKA|nr:Hypothetical protein HINF_LOCUS8527 [Hexamita inflata]CAI9939215.1 Hypothetical protein HINF_LOCUS26860 [Hexamita inflata]
MFSVAQNYKFQKQICNQALVHGWIATIYSVSNLNHVFNISAQCQLIMSQNIKVFSILDLLHWFRLGKKNPQIMIVYIISQVYQIPWLFYQFYVSARNTCKTHQFIQKLDNQLVELQTKPNQMQFAAKVMLIVREEQMFKKLIPNAEITYMKLSPLNFDKNFDFMREVIDNLKFQSPYAPVFNYKQVSVFKITSENQPTLDFATIITQSASSTIFISHLPITDLLLNLKPFLTPNTQIVLDNGDLTGITLGYDTTYFDLVGSAVDSLSVLAGENGKIVVSKKFWAKFWKEIRFPFQVDEKTVRIRLD